MPRHPNPWIEEQGNTEPTTRVVRTNEHATWTFQPNLTTIMPNPRGILWWQVNSSPVMDTTRSYQLEPVTSREEGRIRFDSQSGEIMENTLEDDREDVVNDPRGISDEPREAAQSLTYGQKAVWIGFNPSNNKEVKKLKQLFADIIDILHLLRVQASWESVRHYSVAITELETAQMRAIKALTWVD